MPAQPVMLIIDADQERWQPFQSVLDRIEAQLHWAPNAAAAIALLERGNLPEVIIFDASLPDLSCEALLKEIHRVCPEHAPRLMLVQNEADATQRAWAFEQGIGEILERPFSEIELAARLRLQLAAARASAQAMPGEKPPYTGDLEKNRLLSGMAQQIRIPLNAILGMIELLIDSPLGATQQEYARLIQNSGDALLVLVNDLLDYVHWGSGELELTQTAVDLRSCLDDALELLSSYTAVRNPNIACFIEPEVPEVVRADPVRLRQVLGRLLGYAVQLAEGSEVVALVKARPQGHDQYEIQFVIKKYNSSAGAQRDAARLMDQQATDRMQLGLEICRLLLKKMGGNLSVGCQRNKEVLFYFTIQTIADTRPPTRRRQRNTQPLLGGKSVLVAAHDGQQRNELAQQLLYWQLKPLPVGQMAQALQLIESGRALDAAIFVQHLPEFDVNVFLQRVWHTAAGQNLPLILVIPQGAGQIEALPRLSVVLKEPYKPYQLYEAINRLLVEQHRFQPAAKTATLLDAGMAKRHPLHILLAVFEASEQKVTLGFLERLGYRPDRVENSSEVLRALLRRSYDLLIIDQELLTGDVEVLKKIEQLLPPIARPTVVVLADQRPGEGLLVSSTSNVQSVILKPVHAGDLIDALEDCRPLGMTQTDQRTINPAEGVPVMQEALSEAARQDRGEYPAIDGAFLSQFARMTGGDATALLVQLVDLFTSNAARLLVQMQQAFDSQDATAFLEAAETLRASSANIGARRLAELCAETNKTVQLRGLPAAQDQMTRTLAEYNRVRAGLEQLSKKATH